MRSKTWHYIKAGVKLHVPAALSFGKERPKEPLSEPIPEPVWREFQKKISPPPAGNLREFPRFFSSSPSRYTAYATPANRIILKRILEDMTPGGGSKNSCSVNQLINQLCYYRIVMCSTPVVEVEAMSSAPLQ